MSPNLILQPMLAMMLLTFLVWLRLYQTRIGGMRIARIHPQKVATRYSKSGVHISDREAQASDNLMNLFELPVIFYALCLGIHVSGMTDTVFVVLAWSFTGLRFLHSLIHVTYNRVMHRFPVYVAGGVVMFAMAFRFAWLIF